MRAQRADMDDDENRKIYEEVDNRELELDDELPLLPILSLIHI